MDSRVCFVSVLLSLFLRINLNYSSIDIKDLLPLKCRSAGVLQIEKKFNYSMAETVCEVLGLQLASRSNVQKAWSFGFETCSYGWVKEQYGVISRIQNNEKCGKNLTGVLTWTVPLSRDFSVYCFNASDLRINSCKPGLMVTLPPTTAKPATASPLLPTTHQQQGLPELQKETSAWPVLPTTVIESTSRPLLTTLIATLKPTAKEALPKMTTTMATTQLSEEPTDRPQNQPARQSEKIAFGKLPTALLILALVFFIAAVVLAICYIKKYKTNVFFSKIKEESVEAKVFKETANGDNAKEEEMTTNGRGEKPQNLEATTGGSVEAEV